MFHTAPWLAQSRQTVSASTLQRARLTLRTGEAEGHMIVVEPDGTANAWPVYDQPDLFLRLGSLLEEPVTEIWKRYPYKASHYAKYLGRSIHTVDRAPR